MRELVRAVRNIEKALGRPVKEPVKEEMPNRLKWQRSLVALKEIGFGEILTEKNLGVKRSPVKGLEPKYYYKLLGCRSRSAIAEDEPLTKDSVASDSMGLSWRRLDFERSE